MPFCRRTRGDRKNDPVWEGIEWICCDHWRLVDRRLKDLRNRFRRRRERLMGGWDDYPAGSREQRIILYARRMDRWIWRRMTRQAKEHALGIGDGGVKGLRRRGARARC